MRSFDTQAWVPLVAAGVLCLPLLSGCVYSCDCGSSGGGVTFTPTTPPRTACPFLSKAEVAQATGHAVGSADEAGTPDEGSCAYGSSSGLAVQLSVASLPTTDLRSGNYSFSSLIVQYHLAPVSGVGDQAYTGNGFILVRKGHTEFLIDYQSAGGANGVPAGKREQALKQMASDVLKRLPST